MIATLNCRLRGICAHREGVLAKCAQGIFLKVLSVESVRSFGKRIWFLALMGTFFFKLPICTAENEVSSAAAFEDRSRQVFQAARDQFKANPKAEEAAVKFGQAAFDWADFTKESAERERIALEGIAACRQAIASAPKSAAAHYYLAMNLGQLAQTKRLGALRLVNEMETEFHLARNLDERLDFAGPDRNLGLLYAEAPGWPTSIGNRSKARQHLQRAVILFPNYPEGRINLLEAYLKWSDQTGAQRELKALDELLPLAKKEFSGERWEPSWIDWEKRWKKIQTKASELEKNLESPRNKK